MCAVGNKMADAPVAPAMEEDLTGDGGLRKVIQRVGEGPPAGRGAQVTLRYWMRLVGSETVFDTSDSRRSGVLQFTVGRGKVIAAIDRIAGSMAVGEECETTCTSAYAFGTKGLKRKNVPPNATIVVRVEMQAYEGGIKEKSFAEMSAKERFERAVLHKEAGNRMFKEHKFEKAVAEYTKTIRCIANVFHQPMLPPKPDEEITETSQLKVNPPEQVPSTDVQEAHAVPVTAVLENGAAQTVEEPVQDNGGFTEATVDASIDISTTDAVAVDTVATTPVVADADTQSDARTPVKAKTAEADPGATELAKGDEAPTVEYDEIVDDKPSEDEVLELHVRTLNNLSLCCIRLGEHRSAEEGASLAIRMDDKNFKSFYYR